MKSTIRWNNLLASVLVISVVAAAGVLLSGCAPQQQERAVEEPQAPPVEEPAAPAIEGPEKPAAEEPEMPAAEEPAKSAAEESVKPAAEEPVKPAAEEPVKPAAEEPVKPAAEEPAKPAAEMPAKPAAEEPTKPATEEPAKPTAEKAPESTTVKTAAVSVDPTKVSTFAPAPELAIQLEKYLEELEEAVESEEEYNDSKENIGKDANTLIIIALALGLHDTENKYQKAAPALIEAAQKLAASADFAAAKAGVEAVKAAATSTGGDTATLKWEKVASLPELMKAVPLINSRLKRYLRRFESYADTSASLSSVLAVIAHGSMPNADDTEKPGEVEKWHEHCIQMRDACVSVHAAIRAQDEPAADAAMDVLNQSCEACHAVFKPDAVITSEEQ